jgi:thiosulfate reductase cytochrome b subunit
MKRWFLNRYTKQVIQYLLLLVMVLYLISGFGITEFRIVESLSFGVFSKNVAFVLHNNLLIPMLILLILHIVLGYLSRKFRTFKVSQNN